MCFPFAELRPIQPHRPGAVCGDSDRCFLLRSFDSLKDNLPPVDDCAWVKTTDVGSPWADHSLQLGETTATSSPLVYWYTGKLVYWYQLKGETTSTSSPRNERNDLSGDQLSVTPPLPLATANITFKAALPSW